MKVFIITRSETSLGSKTKNKKIFEIKTSDMPSLPELAKSPLNQNHPPVIVMASFVVKKGKVLKV